jgi:ribosomal protein S18 acetylase RimI-like enzyme
MLRSFRAADGPRLAELVRTNFPEEEELLRWRPGAFEAIVARVYRPHIRFLLWFLEHVGHPIVKVFALEVDGRFVGGALLSYPAQAGYISSVVVDPAYRGRGYGAQIVRACEAAAARARRPYAVLDVLDVNTTARGLYAKLGYETLRHQAYYLREYGASDPSSPPAGEQVRPFVSRDAAALVPIAESVLPPAVAEVLPVHARQFTSIPLVAEGLRSETQAWVVDRGRGAEGFVRATSSAATVSGHLTGPFFSAEVPDEIARAAVRTATEWLRQHQIQRVLTEVPSYNAAGIRALSGERFHAALELQTLYHPIRS